MCIFAIVLIIYKHLRTNYVWSNSESALEGHIFNHIIDSSIFLPSLFFITLQMQEICNATLPHMFN